MLTKLPDFEAMLDEEVVGRVRTGEIALYEFVMRRYNQRLFRIARSIVYSDHEAEDVLQDAYVRAYVHLDQFAGKSTFATWLTEIAIYEARARAKRQKQFENASPGAEDRTMEGLRSSARDPEQQALDCEARTFLEATVDQLPGDYRAVFVMREIEEMTTSETAECLEITEENVKMRLFRARKMIRAGTVRACRSPRVPRPLNFWESLVTDSLRRFSKDYYDTCMDLGLSAQEKQDLISFLLTL
jgi:RNA polymerase sigma-70 factor (ECF subfamily)